jgi:hypothetical protein
MMGTLGWKTQSNNKERNKVDIMDAFNLTLQKLRRQKFGNLRNFLLKIDYG